MPREPGEIASIESNHAGNGRKIASIASVHACNGRESACDLTVHVCNGRTTFFRAKRASFRVKRARLRPKENRLRLKRAEWRWKHDTLPSQACTLPLPAIFGRCQLALHAAVQVRDPERKSRSEEHTSELQ